MQYMQRLEKVEMKLKPADTKDIAVLIEWGETDQEKAASIEKQWTDFLANGGSPDASKIIVKFITAEPQILLLHTT